MRSISAHDVAKTRSAIHQMLIFVVNFFVACNAGSKPFVDVVEHFSFGVQNKPGIDSLQSQFELDEFVIKNDVSDVNGYFGPTLKNIGQ